mgnify:CR=1 FL=1
MKEVQVLDGLAKLMGGVVDKHNGEIKICFTRKVKLYLRPNRESETGCHFALSAEKDSPSKNELRNIVKNAIGSWDAEGKLDVCFNPRNSGKGTAGNAVRFTPRKCRKLDLVESVATIVFLAREISEKLKEINVFN